MHARKTRRDALAQRPALRRRLDLQGKVAEVDRHRRRAAGQEAPGGRQRGGADVRRDRRLDGPNEGRRLQEWGVCIGRQRGRRAPNMVIPTAGLPRDGGRGRVDGRRSGGVMAARVGLGFCRRSHGDENMAGWASAAETEHIQAHQLH